MAATKRDVEEWIERAKAGDYKFILSVCDTWDYEDYPIFCKDETELENERKIHDGVNMQRINEVIEIKNDTIHENLFDIFKGKTKPKKHKIIFVVSQFDEPTIIYGDELDILINDYISSAYLSEILAPNSLKDVPNEVGAYSADLLVHSFTINHPEDPPEHDMNIWLENIKKIELKYD